MSIATAKLDDSSHRFQLVRIRPARFIGDDLSLSGGLYQMTWGTTYKLARIERNGTALTEDSSTPTVNDHWQIASDGTLKIKLASAPNSSTNVIVAFFYLFFTQGGDKVTTLDPEDSATDEVLWEGRLLANVDAAQSFEDILNGVFSISDTPVKIDNSDHDLEALLGSDYSFRRAETVVWQCIGTVSNIQKIFTGEVSDLSKEAGEVSLEVTDTFNRLTQPATMGDSPDECYWRLETGSFPNMDPSRNGDAIPMIFGSHSPWEKTGYAGGFTIPLPTFKRSGVCTNYDPVLSGTVNREWGLCRIPAGISLPTKSFGTLSSAYTAGGIAWAGTASGHNYRPGDSFKVVEQGETYYVYVMQADATGTDNLQGVIVAAVGGTSTHIADVDENSTYTHNAAPAVQIVRPGSDHPYYLAYERDFTYSQTTTSGGNKYIKITIVDDIESQIWSISGDALDESTNPINPAAHDLRYRVSLSGNYGHSDVLQALIEAAGMTADSTTFATAQSGLDVDVLFGIPNTRESDFESYLKYAQDILRSTLGYLSVNASGNVEYALLAAPTSSDSTDETEAWGLSVEVEYQDIVTAIVAVNEDMLNEDDTTNATYKVENAKAKYLHGIDKTIRMSHVLADISGRLADILAVRRAPGAKYRFSTATKHIDSALGDDMQLDHAEVLGGSGSVDLKIMGLRKTGTDAAVEATGLGELT